MLPSPHHSGAWGPGQLPKKRKCQTHLKGEVRMSHHFWSFYSHLLLSPYRAAFNLPPSANRRLHTLQLKCLVSARSENPYTLEGVHSRKIKAHEKKLQPHELGGGHANYTGEQQLHAMDWLDTQQHVCILETVLCEESKVKEQFMDQNNCTIWWRMWMMGEAMPVGR